MVFFFGRGGGGGVLSSSYVRNLCAHLHVLVLFSLMNGHVHVKCAQVFTSRSFPPTRFHVYAAFLTSSKEFGPKIHMVSIGTMVIN